MNRTFHRRFSIQGCLVAVLLAAMSFWCFWMRTTFSPFLGFVLLFMAVKAIGRLIHTTYTFTPDGLLVISSGRLSKAKTIAVADIVGAWQVKGRLLVAGHIVIEYGAGHLVSVQPDNEKAFVDEVRKRLENIDKRKD